MRDKAACPIVLTANPDVIYGLAFVDDERHDPYAYLKDVFTRLPTQPASKIEELLPHRWQPAADRH